jgi:signal peptidase II
MSSALKSHRRLGLILAFVLFAADQVVKYVVTGPLGVNDYGISREIVPFFNLTYTRNYGVSMGFLQANSDIARWGLVALTSALSIGIIVWMWREKNRADIVALGVILGGALANILDRSRLGYVVDYADLHFGDIRPFLIFNVADAAITIGVLVLLVRAFLMRDPGKDANKPVETIDA